MENNIKRYDLANPFQRTGDFPLDISSIFSSYEDALKYAQGLGTDEKKLGKTSYLGQIISIVNNSTIPPTVDVYKIDVNQETGLRQLSEIGSGGGGSLPHKEDKANKVTELTSACTDTQYPTAKAVYNFGGGGGKVKDIKINDTSILDDAGYAKFNTGDGIKAEMENNYLTLKVNNITNPEFVYNNGNFE